MNTRCVFCGHKDLQSSQTQYVYRHNDKFLIVNDVPYLQGTYCGEQYFEGYILKNIEKKFNEIHLHGHKASQEIHIPVEHFLDLQQA
jgi:YgiT-type zinc finger domain-containing protein